MSKYEIIFNKCESHGSYRGLKNEVARLKKKLNELANISDIKFPLVKHLYREE